MNKGRTSKTGEQEVQIQREEQQMFCLKLVRNTSRYGSLINVISYLSSVSPPQAVAGLGGGNGDYWRGTGDTVAPSLAQERP